MGNQESRSTKTRSQTTGLKQLPDSALLEIIALATWEAHRRGIAAAKPFNPLTLFGDRAGGGQLQLIQVLTAIMVDPSFQSRLKTTLIQALLGGCQLAGQATTLLEQTRRNLESIMEPDHLQH